MKKVEFAYVTNWPDVVEVKFTDRSSVEMTHAQYQALYRYMSAANVEWGEV